ncbi:cytidine deaminase [Candidatus Nomurabacteria bacterium]|nr:cytidine deaminase [Candidatus Nomurabacteria bacterium]
MKIEELIEKASSVISNGKSGDSYWGGVGCALETLEGDVYTGVCLDTNSSMGFCAEHNAIGSILTDKKEPKIKSVVAVWKDENGDVYVIPPCGRCRELMIQLDPINEETDVCLDKDKLVKLKELLPYSYKDNFNKIT